MRRASAQAVEHALRLGLQRAAGAGHHFLEQVARAFHVADAAEFVGQLELAHQRVGIFVAQFQRGDNVGDRAVLGRVAAEAGSDAGAVATWLSSEQGREEVLAEERAVRALGVTSVPTFIFDRRHAVVGAEDPAVLAEAIRHCWKA